jgi:hypothetical protein
LSFVDLNTNPAKGLDDVFFGTWHKPILVGIFNTKQHFATHFAGKQVVIKCGTHTTDVQWTSRTGREPNANGF